MEAQLHVTGLDYVLLFGLVLCNREAVADVIPHDECEALGFAVARLMLEHLCWIDE